MGAENEGDGRATFESILGQRKGDPNNIRDYYFMFVPLMSAEEKERYFSDFPEMKEAYEKLKRSIKRNDA